MKNLVPLAGLVLLIATQCSNKEPIISDCGCNSSVVVKSLQDVNATIEKKSTLSTSKDYYILLDRTDDDLKYFSSLIPCDTTVLNIEGIQEGAKVKISGLIRPYCTGVNIRVWSNPVEITKIESLTIR